MRIAIVSRIYAPEPSAASFRLSALARAFLTFGHRVDVLTVRPPAQLRDQGGSDAMVQVSRFPVLRDRQGYVRGYLPYLSFDVPLYFRILFGRRRDLIVVEPPPTTGLAVRLAAALRRTDYVYYAADIWSDASSQTGAPQWIVRGVRAIELWALRGAQVVLSVSEGVTKRLAELGVTGSVVTIGNGIDIGAFGSVESLAIPDTHAPSFVYAGTASEWHGAEVFVEAFPTVLAHYPRATLRFIGGGARRAAMESRARVLGIERSVCFEEVRPLVELGPVLGAATAALASVRPGAGYDFAFPTKLYSAAVCGVPLIYAGIGPGADFVRTHVDGAPLGEAVGLESSAVAEAMLRAADRPFGKDRRAAVASWARDEVSLTAVAHRAVEHIQAQLPEAD